MLGSNLKVRGKCIKNNKWYYGWLYGKLIVDVVNDKSYYLLFNMEYNLESQLNYLTSPLKYSHLAESVIRIVPESAGKFTELKDMKGDSICSGDILLYKDGRKVLVIWNSSCAMFDSKGLNVVGIARPLYDKPCLVCNIIGNKTDNPELLELR